MGGGLHGVIRPFFGVGHGLLRGGQLGGQVGDFRVRVFEDFFLICFFIVDFLGVGLEGVDLGV